MPEFRRWFLESWNLFYPKKWSAPKNTTAKHNRLPSPFSPVINPPPPCNSWWPRLEKSSNQISWGSFTMPPICWTKKSPCQKLVTFLFFDIVSLQMWYEYTKKERFRKQFRRETQHKRMMKNTHPQPPRDTGYFTQGHLCYFYTYFLPYEITPPPKINLQASEYPKMNPSVAAFWNFPVSLDKNWTKSNWFICRYINSPKIQLLFKFWWLLQLQL